jgi:glycosyltransferase involved in cell wall biosynthesis
MKIFFFSTTFAPNVGGIEKQVEILCTEFAAMGHQVRLATISSKAGEDCYDFAVIRKPSLGTLFRLMNWCDIHVQANISLKYAFLCLLRPSRVIYQHNNVYQQDDGTLKPLDRLKQLVGRHTPGIACSRYVATKLRCTETVFNAYDDSTFSRAVPWEARDRDLVFLGRLVSQKGCDVLLRAVGRLRSGGLVPTLTIIGDGPDRKMLEALALETGVNEQVRFTGTLQGPSLAAELARHRFLVVPSRYEEPFGMVAVEGLACGCVPVVSEQGGLVDAIGGFGFTVPNGDDAALAATLKTVLTDSTAARARLNGVQTHLAGCQARAVAKRYISIFEHVLGPAIEGRTVRYPV